MALPRVTLAVCAFIILQASFAVADDVIITPITKYSEVLPPLSDPFGRKFCVVDETVPTAQPLTGKSVLVFLDHGAEYYDTIVAIQYFKTRGATVTGVCPDSDSPKVLLDAYYPQFQLDCVNMATTTASNFDIFFIPEGYSSTLALRANAAAMGYLRNFVSTLAVSTTASNRVVIMSGSSSELLIDSDLIPYLPQSVQFPYTTKILANAFDFITSKQDPPSPVKPPVANVSIPYNTFLSRSGPNSAEQSTSLYFAVSSNVIYLNEVLAQTSSVVYGFHGDRLPLNCSINGDKLNPMVVPALSNVTETVFPSLAQGTNVNSKVVNATLDVACKNPSGVDFCDGDTISVIVAHGSHDVEVISAVEAYKKAGAVVRIFCPDDLTLTGHVYLSPFPAKTVTHSITCTRYYNSSLLAQQSLVVVPGGPVATHRRLKDYDPLIEVMQYTGQFSLFGTAMILLTTQDIKEKLVTVPSCPYTDVDLANIGFNNSGSTIPEFVRNSDKGRTKVLAGYAGDAVTAQFESFLTQSVWTLVWKNEKETYGDRAFGAIYISLCGIATVIVVVAMCVRSRRAADRQTHYVSAAERGHPAGPSVREREDLY